MCILIQSALKSIWRDMKICSSFFSVLCKSPPSFTQTHTHISEQSLSRAVQVINTHLVSAIYLVCCPTGILHVILFHFCTCLRIGSDMAGSLEVKQANNQQHNLEKYAKIPNICMESEEALQQQDGRLKIKHCLI